MEKLMSFLKEEDGITALEYGLIAGLVTLGIITFLSPIGTWLKATFSDIAGTI